MHKLCTLKEIVPGSVVELPREYGLMKGETAIVLGLEYDTKKRIRAEFLRRAAGKALVAVTTAAQPEDTKLALVDDKELQKASIEGFAAGRVPLPDMGMSVGCDPEIFVVHHDDSVFPAWEYMPDEAQAKASIKSWMATKSGASESSLKVFCASQIPAYWDGAQAEFAPWAKHCLEALHYGTRTGLQEVLAYARAKDITAKLTLQNVVALPDEVLKNAADKHIQFRCSPSLNIYNDPGEQLHDARQYKFRCAGGHIHLGYSRAFTANGIEQIVRGLDGVLGVAGVSLAAGIDDPERRHSYGRAGEFRLPKHGIEYRVLSNFWLSHPAISMLVFEVARATVRFAESGLYNLAWQADESETREVINNCDVSGARKILRRNLPVLTGLINNLWSSVLFNTISVTKMRALALKTIMEGIGAAVKDPLDIEGNWKLGAETWGKYCREDNWEHLANAN